MDWKKLSIEETLKKLNSDINGLTSSQAQENLSKYGKNELVEEEKPGHIKLFLGPVHGHINFNFDHSRSCCLFCG